MPQSYKAVIVGAGPIGAALALALARIDASAQILLLDASAESPRHAPELPDARIFAVNQGSRAVLEDLGVWSSIAAARCNPYDRMHVWDAQGTGSVEFDAREFGVSHLGHIVEANLITATLLDAVAVQSNIEFIRPERVEIIGLPTSADGLEQLADLRLGSGRQIHTELICAADGAKSSLRAMAGIRVREEEVGQEAIVANLFHEQPNESCAWQIFHPTGPLAFLPLDDFQGRHLSSIVWSLDKFEAARVKQLSDAEFEAELALAIEEKFGGLSLASDRYSFPLVQRHVRDYVLPSFALVGDAAHSIHPLAGLGANIGFQDVQSLAMELQRVTKRELHWGDIQALKRYQRSRRLANELVLQSMKGFKQFFGQRNHLVSGIRNLGLMGVDAVPALKRRFVAQAAMRSRVS